jgi:hypothetical protein
MSRKSGETWGTPRASQIIEKQKPHSSQKQA